ncbi:MAG: fluoride efflux transporter FluC [Henriciella sp.]|nr:CrcB family protein [Hyphomonadaceae bacterium]
MNGLVLVAIGGAIGASMRYGVGLAFTEQGGMSGAWATLFVNVVGSFILGAMMGWFSSREPAIENTLWLLVGVGMMGAFTTFSAFSRDTVHMFMTGDVMKGLVFAGLNMVGALAAFAVGLIALKRLLA